MRRDPKQRLPLAQVHAHEREISRLEVPQPAMDDARRGGRRAAAEIVFLDEHDAQPAERRIPRHAAPDNAPADHRDIEGLPLGRREPAQ
jgi:hypothetical protein